MGTATVPLRYKIQGIVQTLIVNYKNFIDNSE